MSTKEEVPDQADYKHDIESMEKPPKSNATQVLEAAALLTLWSVLVINEGAIRFIGSDPSNLDRTVGDGELSPYLIFFGGLAEVIFGIFGLFVGYSAFISRAYSPAITKLCMLTQSVLGWFVFIVFVFAQPAVKSANLPAPLPGLSMGASRFFITLGIFTSFHFCLALQGGQFLFMARLISAADNVDFLKQNSGNTMRAIFWNANMALAGLWTLISGAMIAAEVNSRETGMPYESPPNVIKLPGFTITTGLILLIWGLVGIYMAMSKTNPSYYYIGTGVAYLMALLNYGIAQFGTFADRTAGGPIALHNGLVFMVVFLGPYFVTKSVNDEGSL